LGEISLDIDLRRLRIFAAVASNLSFTKASKELFLAQTAVSRQIACLEEELGVRLLTRDRRSVQMTAAGERLFQQLPEIQKTVGRCLAEVTSLAVEPKVGVVITPARWFLPRFLQSRIDLVPSDPCQLRTGLERGEIDLAITRDENADLPCLLHEEFVLVASLQDKGLERKLDDLLLFDPEGCPEVRLKQLDWLAFLGKNCAGLRSFGSISALLTMVESGLGCALIPACCLFQQEAAFQTLRLHHPPRMDLRVGLSPKAQPAAVRLAEELLHQSSQLQQEYDTRLQHFRWFN